ncbi:MAG: citrate (Si)-synthase [Deltaproteobacteria bacterium RIFCSPLOWO2_02_FULL_50_16]|nr:MAG: citrate (Si)-synthase [Deltaproteobacteria bacterium RIFCSPLOWO2_02_FULL_50_16]
MSNTAKLTLEGKDYELPTLVGTEKEKAIDIRALRKNSGYITFDPAYVNTGACQSAITFIDGEKGILRYRGIPIEELAEHSTFTEVAYLLIYGHLPNKKELGTLKEGLTRHSMIHEDMKNFYNGYPSTAHPMAILSAMVGSLSAYYPNVTNPGITEEEMHDNYVRLISKVRTIAAASYKKSIGQPIVYPRNDLSYCANFLYMMFAVPSETYKIDEELVKTLTLLLIVHADHEQNCSTSTVRLVGSSKANLFASISAGICALWGHLHGGANQQVIEMLEKIQREKIPVKKIVEQAKDKNSGFRLMGFGHRVYKNFDPRANILRAACDRVFKKLGIQDPLLNIAKELEQAALEDNYFVERKLYPNVDFYSGILYRAMEIPTNMFTVMFAIGRLPGWIAHYRELNADPDFKIGRPRQIYTGEVQRSYVPIDKRR